jgi:parallel beta-helix repeat protein
MGQNKSKMVLTAALAFLFVIAFAASVASADDPPCTCGDICVNTTGWWRDGGTFKASSTPIQHAIDNATAGDTICVMDGTYNENVDVTKSDLTIRSENGPLVTTVSASLYPNKHVFKITDQTDVTLKGFEIRDAHGTTKDVAGIYMDNANECNISDNRVTNISATGDYNGADGIWLRSSSNNSFVTTTVYNLSSADSSARGIDLRSSSGNSFHTTSVYNLSAYRAYGIWLDSSSGNSFDTTTVYNLDADNDTRGIMLDFSSDNSFHTTTVYNLSADKYAFGILLDSSSYNSPNHRLQSLCIRVRQRHLSVFFKRQQLVRHKHHRLQSRCIRLRRLRHPAGFFKLQLVRHNHRLQYLLCRL